MALCKAAQITLCHASDCDKCFQKSFASHPKASCWSDKNEKKPRDVFKSSNKKYIINCDICNHEIHSTLGNISAGKWCSYCANPPQKLCNNTECQDCFQKSFASHPKASCWSDKNEKKPRDVFKSSNKKYIFNCDTCNHEFQSVLASISSGGWCPYCAKQKLCNNTECQDCFQKSFASHPKACFWSDKNEKKPRDVFKSSGTKYTFNCNACNHEFISVLSNISIGQWCSYCENKKLCDNTTCNECFQKSFASHPKASCWSDKNEKKPRDVFKSSNTKYTLNCDTCNHEFHSVLASISKGQWCPYCVNKTELKLYQWLTEVVPDMEREKTFEWCVNENTGKCFRYDFHSQTMKLLIELDGAQHFTQVSNWGCPIQAQQRDIFKMKKANDNGYSVLRLLQEDVFYDVYDWKKELCQIFQSHTNATITNTYVCKNEEYQVHKELFDKNEIAIEMLIDEDDDDSIDVASI